MMRSWLAADWGQIRNDWEQIGSGVEAYLEQIGRRLGADWEQRGSGVEAD